MFSCQRPPRVVGLQYSRERISGRCREDVRVRSSLHGLDPARLLPCRLEPLGAALVGWVKFKNRAERLMCLSPDAYVFARVYERLVSRGVADAKARGVAMKVARRYSLKRQQSATRRYPPGDGD